jgi:hypothetical protein
MTMLSRWPVVVSSPIDAADLDCEGRLTSTAVERVFALARAAYFERSPSVDWVTADSGPLDVRRGGVVPDGTDHVTVSAGVVELFPDHVVIAGRVRAPGTDDVAADVRTSIALRDGVTDGVRDALIALAHDAQHFH